MNFTTFFTNFITIYNPVNRKFDNIVPYEHQIKLANDWDNNTSTISLCSRQIGSTTILAAYCLYSLLYGSRKRVLVVFPNKFQSDFFSTMVVNLYANLPNHITAKNMIVPTKNHICNAENDLFLYNVSSDTTNIRGWSFDDVLIDGHYTDHTDESMLMVMQQLRKNGKIIANFQTSDRNNVLYRMYEDHINDDDTYVFWKRLKGDRIIKSYNFPYTTIPGRDVLFKKRMVEMISEEIFRKEYENIVE